MRMRLALSEKIELMILRLIQIIFVVACSASFVLAQSGADSRLSKTSYGRNSRVTQAYDLARNITLVNLKPVRIAGTVSNGLELQAFAYFHGRTPLEKPVIVSLFIISTAKNETFDSNRELVFLLDGERLSAGTMQRGDRSCWKHARLRRDCAYWVEKMDLFVPYRHFRRIVNAKKVEGRIGTRPFELKGISLEALRNFASRLEPQGVKEF
jgi:uncharacterized protein (UPF0333 family)